MILVLIFFACEKLAGPAGKKKKKELLMAVHEVIKICLSLD